MASPGASCGGAALMLASSPVENISQLPNCGWCFQAVTPTGKTEDHDRRPRAGTKPPPTGTVVASTVGQVPTIPTTASAFMLTHNTDPASTVWPEPRSTCRWVTGSH